LFLFKLQRYKKFYLKIKKNQILRLFSFCGKATKFPNQIPQTTAKNKKGAVWKTTPLFPDDIFRQLYLNLKY